MDEAIVFSLLAKIVINIYVIILLNVGIIDLILLLIVIIISSVGWLAHPLTHHPALLQQCIQNYANACKTLILPHQEQNFIKRMSACNSKSSHRAASLIIRRYFISCLAAVHATFTLSFILLPTGFTLLQPYFTLYMHTYLLLVCVQICRL